MLFFLGFEYSKDLEETWNRLASAEINVTVFEISQLFQTEASVQKAESTQDVKFFKKDMIA